MLASVNIASVGKTVNKFSKETTIMTMQKMRTVQDYNGQAKKIYAFNKKN